MTVVDRSYVRPEVEVAADAVWALIAAGLVVNVSMAKIVEVSGVSLLELRRARERAERVPERRVVPARVPVRPVLVRTPPPCEEREEPARKLPAASLRAVASEVFTSLRAAGWLTCTRCGKPLVWHDEVIVTAAHHVECP